MSILLSLLLFALAGLVCNATGGFASRLAGCLAFATAANSYALFQVTRFNCFDSLHGLISILIMKILVLKCVFLLPIRENLFRQKIASYTEKVYNIIPRLSRRILKKSRISLLSSPYNSLLFYIDFQIMIPPFCLFLTINFLFGFTSPKWRSQNPSIFSGKHGLERPSTISFLGI